VEGPLLILAGAGSGKTRVITHRIAHLIVNHRVYGPSVLAVTFTNKAAGEMKERVLSLLPEGSGPGSAALAPTVSTFHSFCVRLLRRDGDSLAEIRPGFTRNFTIYDDDDQLALVKQIFKRLGLDEKFMQYRAALSRISHAKNHQETPQDLHNLATDPKTARLAVIYEQYEAGLRQANALDFDDLLLESVRLLTHDEELRHLWNRRIQFLMIDEYQDTNRSQYQLMRLLSDTHKNVAVVGDEDQSIYGWRGADIRNILDFERDYPDATVIRLEQNYRSTKNILEAASAVVANNKERKGKWLWTDAASGTPIGIYEAIDGENEALFIADTINSILTRQPDTRVAILYRTNFQSRQIEEALRRYGRPYKVVGGFSFYQRAEVKDALAYLKLLTTRRDNVSLLRIINTPARGIGRTTLDQVEAEAARRNIALWDALELAVSEHWLGGRAEAAIAAFLRLIEELSQEAERGGVEAALKGILERTGYWRMLQQDTSPESESRQGNLEELLTAAAEAVERGETIAEFLDHAALVSDADTVDEGATIGLLTMHNAKGLEFPVVFIAGMEEGLFPHSRSRDSEAQMEEERRLCYVAMTRAERRLYLSWARYRRRFGGGQPEPTLPSRFLKEVPRHLVEKLNPEREPRLGDIDLHSERHEVRETARRNTYTGRTYNSIEHINQFFAERNAPASGKTPIASPVMTPVTPQALTPAAPPAQAVARREEAGQSDVPPLFRDLPQPPRNAPSPPPTPSAPAYPARKPPNAPLPPPPSASPRRRRGLEPGATVMHAKYGRGTLLRKEGDGEDAKLTISFKTGLKKMVAKYADLTVEE